MGLFDGRRSICFSIPKEQYRVLEVMLQAAESENPDFDPNEFFEMVLANWLDQHWKEPIKKMVYMTKKTRGRRK